MDLSISQAHVNCVSAFLALIEASRSPSYTKRQSEAQDIFDRYKLWAGNVGAIHGIDKYRLSLDYRLREASFYKSQILKLMQDLQSCLHKASVTFLKEHGATVHPLAEDSEPSGPSTDESDSSDSPWEVSSDSEVEQQPEKKLRIVDADRKNGRPQSPAKPALLGSINFIVECLWRLPIRRPAPADRMKDKNVADTTGYLPFDLMYVKDKFPDLHETVTARLAKMISRRRQLIRYRKDHTDALQEEKAAIMVKIPEPGNNPLSSPLKVDVASESTPSLKTPSQRTELTKATTLKLNAPMGTLWPATGLYAQSVSDSGSSIASEQTANAITIRFPHRPRTKEGRVLEQYICPYCSTAQITTSERRWKKHVLSDLQPYMCTYADCQLNDYFFENKDDWFHHESHTHRVEWFCNTASHESFVDMEEFLVHMHKVHSEPLDKTQLLNLHRGFQRPSNAHSGTCTLCGQYASKLKSHLARHLEQLALFAIPQTDYMAALEEDDTSSNAARKGFHALSNAGSSDLASGISDLEFDPEVGNLASNLAKLHPGNTPREQLNEGYSIPPGDLSFVDMSDDSGDEVDTSWDQITPKFKEARVAMESDQEAEASEHQIESSRNSLMPEESTRNPSIEAIFDLPREPLPDVPAQSYQTSATFDASRLERRDVLEIPTIPYEEPRSAPKPPPLSRRQRVGRFASNILSPFRRQKEAQPADDVYPKVAYLYDPAPSRDRGRALDVSPSPSSARNPEMWPEVPGESSRNPNLHEPSLRFQRHGGGFDPNSGAMLGVDRVSIEPRPIYSDPRDASLRKQGTEVPNNSPTGSTSVVNPPPWRQGSSTTDRGRSNAPTNVLGRPIPQRRSASMEALYERESDEEISEAMAPFIYPGEDLTGAR